MKTRLLFIFLAAMIPLQARAFTTDPVLSNDEVLSYVAMPLAVSNVCEIRGVQTDQVGNLVSYMDQANVSPEGFIDVFRYVPVALVLNSGRSPDFVEWVGGQVAQGVTGDELVTVMERRLTTYSDVVSVPRTYRQRRSRIYDAVYEPYYVPAGVQRYCERELLDPFALIDMPVAVATVVDIGVPYDRVGRLVVQLNLGYVPPLQTVELLRYAPSALIAVDYGQPDFVQYVYDQRLSGLSGYPLVQVVDRQLGTYGIAPQVDLTAPVYIGQNDFVPAVVQNYVDPINSAYIPPVVQTRVAGFAAGLGSFAPAAPIATASPQVQRLLSAQGGSAVVVNPAQARRELAQSSRAEREAARVAGVPPAAMTSPQGREGHGHRMAAAGGGVVPAPAPGIAAVHGGGGRHEHAAARGRMTSSEQPAMVGTRPARGGGREHGRPQAAQPPMMAAPPPTQHGHGHDRPQAQPVTAAPPPSVEHGHGNGHGQGGGGPQPQAMVAPAPAAPAVTEHGHGNGRGHNGPPPQAMAVPAPAPPPAAQQDNGHGQGGPPAGKSQGEKKGKKQ